MLHETDSKLDTDVDKIIRWRDQSLEQQITR